MKRPLVFIALFFCSGIIFVNLISIPFSLIYLFAVISFVFTFFSLKEIRFNIFLIVLAFLLGAVMMKNSQSLPKCYISKYNSCRTQSIIKGIINNEPAYKNNRTTFIFKTQEIVFGNLRFNCCGNILVYLKGKQNLEYGEELIFRGNLCQVYGFGRYRRMNFKDYLFKKGIYSILYVKRPFEIIRVNKNRGLLLKRFSMKLKRKAKEITSKSLSDLSASILNAMMLGERKNIPFSIRNSMAMSGTVHILVVSGFHVGIVAFIITLILKLLRIPRNFRFCAAIFSLIVYCLLTGASIPTVRATAMSIFFLIAFLLRREPDIYNSCAIALIFILMANPLQLFDAGFQLSFASVLSIVYFYSKFKSFLHLESLKIKYLKIMLQAGIVSFSAWLGTMGLIAYYFKIFSPVTVIANIFIAPLAVFITLCGFSLILAGYTFPLLCPFFASTTELAVYLLLKINSILLKLPFSHFYL